MAQLQSLTINDTGSLTLPSGTIAQRSVITATVQSFTSVGTTSWTAPAGVTAIDVLVVAGGGGGGSRHGGGGGAGGVVYKSAFPVVPGSSYIVTVGAGGAGAESGSGSVGSSGGNSVFGPLTAIGGGPGSSVGNAAQPSTGGSGGGNRGNSSGLGGAGTIGQGTAGGNGGVVAVNGQRGGGGGGAGRPGGLGGEDGRGGDGLQFDISGTLVWYAGGGGSGTDPTGALGGLGGGGNGNITGGDTSTAGTPNTGGGGGAGGHLSGTNYVGKSGGSGIVIIRYANVPASTNPAGETRINTSTATLESISPSGTWNVTGISDNIVTSGLLVHLDASVYSSGNTWPDISGNNLNFTLFGNPTYSRNIVGGEFTFDGGTSQFVGYPSFYGAVLVGSSSVTAGNWDGDSTYEAWVCPTTIDGTQRHVFTDNNFNEGELRFTSSGINVAFGGSTSISYARVPVIGQWYHIALVHYRDTSKAVYRAVLYVNGEFAGSTAATAIPSSGSFYGPDGQLNVGYAWAGQISSFRLYNRTLSQSEILKNYNAQQRRFNKDIETTEIVNKNLIFHVDCNNPQSYTGDYISTTNTLVDIARGHAVFTPASLAYGTNYVGLGTTGDTTNYITVDRAALNGLREWTIDFWLMREATNSIDTFLTCGANNDFLWFFNSASQLEFQNTAGNTVSYSVTNGQIFHFSATGKHGVIQYYKNGQRLGSFTNNTTIPVTSTIGIILGNEMDSSGGSLDANQKFLGRYYAIKFYNRALSTQEVNQNYQALRGRYGI
jgi:hypothetical protein